MNTFVESKNEIGKTFNHKFEDLIVKIKINDIKYAYGVKRYLVSIDGQESNQVWIYAPKKINFLKNK